MLFKRKPKPPISRVVQTVGDAVEAAYGHLRDRNSMPTEEELRQIDALAKMLWESYCTVQYISRNLHQRFRGEPEGAKKFTDAEVFEYHYPQ